MRVKCLVLALVLFPSLAHASPWLLRDKKVAFFGKYDYEVATSEFLDDSERVAFPLRGKYASNSLTLDMRVGLFDKYELQVSVPLKSVSYTSDPVILIPQTDANQDPFDYYQENVIDFTQSELGIGDVNLSGRYQLFYGRIAGALGLNLKLPTGYESPSGTFGENPNTEQEFIDNAATFVSPENVRDDVTLGDGQLDVTPMFHFGVAAPWGTFARADVGYSLRLGGAGDEFVAGLKVGQVITRKWVIFGGANFTYAVQDGRRIGISVAAIDPELPANEFRELNNISLREVRLDKDLLQINAGAIFRVLPNVELNAAYNGIVWGRNVSAINAFSISLGFQLSFDEDEELE